MDEYAFKIGQRVQVYASCEPGGIKERRMAIDARDGELADEYLVALEAGDERWFFARSLEKAPQ